jgi:Zn finger protein HypA/HybF involved in hydrogenase expression
VAHLWLMDADGAWDVYPLADSCYLVDRLPPATVGSALDASGGAALLPAHEQAVWVLVTHANVTARVNGCPLRLGLRVLADRDEIQIAGVGTFFFSTESLARIESLPMLERVIACARCKLPIEPKSPAVRCPSCKVWYHERDDYPCWTYSEHCALCARSTRLDGRYHWRPEESWM